MNSRRRMMMAAIPKKAIIDIPLGSKIKLSSGKKFIVQAKNVEGHEANSVTLVGEFVTESYRWDNYESTLYLNGGVHTSIMPRYYEELNQQEKNSIIKRVFKVGNDRRGYGASGWAYYDAESYFWVPSCKELNLPSGAGYNAGYNFGFTDDASRIKKFENGNSTGYYTSSSCNYGSWGGVSSLCVFVVNSDGAEELETVISGSGSITFTTGVLPCCDIKGTTKCKKGADGYWRIAE